MKIKKVSIQAFRAYNDIKDGTFDFSLEDGEPSNFVVLYAPNGFGKSSFYDAVEWAFTKSIARYVRATNRTNNTLTADNSKTPNTPQFILRNHEAPSTVKTSVHVRTTHGDFKRNLSATAEGTRDFSFQGKVAKGREAFRDIFLSQDGIDAFIRETKPTERYERFMDSFCSDAESIRKKLYALKAENNQTVLELKERIERLTIALSEPVDLQPFEQFNLTAESLGNVGSKLKLQKDNFSSASEANLRFIIADTKSTLQGNIDSESKTLEILNQLHQLSLPAQQAEEQIAKIAPEFTRLSSAVTTSRKHKDISSQLEADKTSLQNKKNELNELTQVLEKLEHYHKTKRLILDYETALTDLKVKVTSESVVLDASLKSVQNLSETILKADQSLNGWKVYGEEVPSSFIVITTESEKVKQVDSEIGQLEPHLAAQNLACSVLKDKQGKLNSLRLDRHNVVSSVAGLITIDEDIVLRIALANRTIDLLDASLRDNAIASEKAQEQSGILEQLVALGHAFLTDHKTSNCPLCSKEHPSHEELLNKIANNEAISSLQRQLQQQSTEFSAQRDMALGEAGGLVSLVKSKIDFELFETQRSLAEHQDSAASINATITQLRSDQENSRQRLLSAQDHTLHMSNEALSEHIKSQIKIWEDSKALHQQGLLQQKEIHNRSSAQILQLKEQEANLITSINQLKIDTLYCQVLAYIEKLDWLQNANINELFSQRNEELSTSINQIIERTNKAATEIATLQQTMHQLGTWLQDALIEQNYSALHAERTALQNLVQNFKNAFTVALNIESPSILENTPGILLEKITNASSNRQLLESKLRTCETLQSQLGALIPYVERVALEKELAPLETLRLKHELVHQQLDSEMQNVIQHLESRISEFFYDKLINEIYKKIDPHPTFKTVEFIPTFDQNEKPSLHILVVDENNNRIPPTLYFSAAQLNILSLSIFLAKALHASYNNLALDAVFIDDPIHSMDSINVLSTIDLLRNISQQFNKQIIISTHDENFFRLLQKKISPGIFGSKFLKLESFGVVTTETISS
ncbi:MULTISPECIES: AAA family ATPase [Pseudomonas]|uniref:AAA family ATPase n=1 Tax=Pseudomonas TaxID=286 RepID=UPI001BEA9608|nr:MULTISPECIES: AAA family ATPase [Pseudomonas]MBT2342258.1 AAA family ATPase [Pseudomonas fluorescens]MCD4532302.1 AAA family ATPase [Pseudomonas sp. C3-2018]